MKKLLAMLLALVMVLSLGACGEKVDPTDAPQETEAPTEADPTDAPQETEAPTEADPYAEKLTITMTGVNTTIGGNYDTDFIRFYEEKFNIDLEIMNNEWDGSAERFNLQAGSGSLHDANLWLDFGVDAYLDYVDQGLFRALPEDWAERWPNLYKMANMSGILEYMTVDGLVYGVPHSIFGGIVELKQPTAHGGTLYLRNDWLNELGMSNVGAEGYVTLEELKNYLIGVKDKGLCEKPVLAGNAEHIINLFANAYGIPYSAWVDEGEGYVWTPTREGYTDMVAEIQEWYKEGLIDADFYLKDKNDFKGEFQGGKYAALAGDGDAGTLVTHYRKFVQDFPGKTNDDLLAVWMAGNDGVIYGNGIGNYWLATVFRPDLDDATMERILDLMEYCSYGEGQVSLQCGVPGVDWTYGEDGRPMYLEERGSASKMYGNDSWNAMFMLAWCTDDFVLGGMNPAHSAEAIAKVQNIYKMKDAGYLFPNAQSYSLYNSDLKTAYNGAINLNDLVTQIVVDGKDVEGTISDYIEDNRNIWEPLMKDVNASLGY